RQHREWSARPTRMPFARRPDLHGAPRRPAAPPHPRKHMLRACTPSEPRYRDGSRLRRRPEAWNTTGPVSWGLLFDRCDAAPPRRPEMRRDVHHIRRTPQTGLGPVTTFRWRQIGRLDPYPLSIIRNAQFQIQRFMLTIQKGSVESK